MKHLYRNRNETAYLDSIHTVLNFLIAHAEVVATDLADLWRVDILKREGLFKYFEKVYL